ncbi:MAG TPA: amino acid adenylation domain-containing protein, partial [Ktedonobacteraceae bacterium]|nr:amino acid adenylation domain-containing protein [Ktedonobacteraceae bacterium]
MQSFSGPSGESQVVFASAEERGQCVHELFEQQARQQPEAIALVQGEAQLSYGELNRRANQLAHWLQREAGVEPETLVAVCLERSLELVIALLAVLKAGGAYVPLDPGAPPQRQAFLLQEAQTPLLLTQQTLASGLADYQGRLLCLDTSWESLGDQPSQNPDSSTIPACLAYVIYTSGSTGQPKGVPVSHANILRLFATTHPSYQFDHSDVWTLFHSCAFDFSVWELWGALLHGGRLVVVSYLVSRSPEDFYQLLSREYVTVVNQTPSAFSRLIWVEETLHATQELAVRLVIFGGEALDFRKVQPWFDRHGDQVPRLVNMYGITETTVHVTSYPLSLADGKQAHSVIGRPISDLQIYLLDEQQHLVPSGEVGELYIGGAGLARGYLNHPDWTAERFVPHPFSQQPGARLYRTGDLARYRADGLLEYLGRCDQQVKLRGFRIELGEIEHTLLQHPAVREAVVLAREEWDGGKQLVAYVVLTQPAEEGYDWQQLRAFLQERLPDYMLPSHLVRLETLPLTSNGKLDRQALPAPQPPLPPAQTALAPQTEREQILAAIWSRVLRVPQVGLHDNF